MIGAAESMAVTLIDEFDRNRMRVGLGLQQLLPQKGGVQKGAGSTRVDQGHNKDGEKAREEKAGQKSSTHLLDMLTSSINRTRKAAI